MATGAWATTSRSWRRSRSSASSARLRRVMSRATAWKPTTFEPSIRSCTFWPIQISSPPRVTAMNSSYGAAHAVAELGLEVRLHAAAMVLADELEEVLADDLLRRPARHARGHRVHVGEEPPHVRAVDDVLRVLDELPVAPLAVAQALGGGVQGRDVGEGDDHAVHPAVGADLGIGVDEQPDRVRLRRGAASASPRRVRGGGWR